MKEIGKLTSTILSFCNIRHFYITVEETLKYLTVIGHRHTGKRESDSRQSRTKNQAKEVEAKFRNLRIAVDTGPSTKYSNNKLEDQNVVLS